MNLFDTHTHLFLEQFNDDRTKVVDNAINAGISKMVLPGISSQYIDSQIELSRQFPDNCFVAVGLHPSSVKTGYEKELEIVEKYISTGKYVAVGEIGIDLYWDENKKYIKQQKEAFEFQIILAKKYKLPIIIHARESLSEIFEIVEKHNDENLTGIFHSFTGNIEQAQKIIKFQNFKIGINGIVTFKKSEIQEVVKHIDMEHIVLETDSPFLSPSPKRGKRNDSSHLIYIAKKIAELKEIQLSELEKQTTKNAHEIFKL